MFSSKKPEFTSSLPNPRSDTIDPSYYLYQSPVPKAWAVKVLPLFLLQVRLYAHDPLKKHTSKLISPHSTTTPISISSSLRSNHFNRPRYGLSQSLVVQSSFKACGLVVICGNREDEYTGGLYEDDRSNEEEAEEAETDGGDTELLMEMENDDWSLPLSPLQNWENFQDHQSTTDQTGSPKSWEFQLTPPGMSYWAPTAPTAPTQTPEPKVECPKWKPNHTAAGILRDEEWMSAFEKIPATYLRPLQSSSILSKHFCPSRNTSQGQEPQKTLPNSPTASMTIDSESDFKSFPKDLSSLRAIQQEADAKRNFAGERDIWRHHADMISAEPKISVTTRSSPEICYRRATTPQSPAPIPPAAIQLGGGVADRSMSGLPTILEAFPRRSAPIQIPRRRAYSVAYPTPLSTIPASPRETSIKNYSGIQPGPKGNNQRNGRKFKTVRKVIKKPNQD